MAAQEGLPHGQTDAIPHVPDVQSESRQQLAAGGLARQVPTTHSSGASQSVSSEQHAVEAPSPPEPAPPAAHGDTGHEPPGLESPEAPPAPATTPWGGAWPS